MLGGLVRQERTLANCRATPAQTNNQDRTHAGTEKCHCSGFRNRIASQRKRGIEGCSPSDDIGSGAQPIRCEAVISDPALQVTAEGGTRGEDGLWRREPQEVEAGAYRFRAEEVVICRKKHAWIEAHVYLNFFSHHIPFPTSLLIRDGMDAVHD